MLFVFIWDPYVWYAGSVELWKCGNVPQAVSRVPRPRR